MLLASCNPWVESCDNGSQAQGSSKDDRMEAKQGQASPHDDRRSTSGQNVLIRQFMRENYESHIEINLVEPEDALLAFQSPKAPKAFFESARSPAKSSSLAKLPSSSMGRRRAKRL